MGRYNYRMNRTTYAVYLAGFVIVYTILVSTMTRPPALAEVLVALIGIPRLHDIGRSGWWLVVLLAGEFVAIAIGWPGGEDGILIAAGLYFFFGLLVLVVLGFIPGQSDANRWGEPPPPGFRWRATPSAKGQTE